MTCKCHTMSNRLFQSAICVFVAECNQHSIGSQGTSRPTMPTTIRPRIYWWRWCSRMRSNITQQRIHNCRSVVNKIEKVVQTTDNASPLATFTKTSHQLRMFEHVTVDEVRFSIRRLPDNSCAADPIPVSILKQLSPAGCVPPGSSWIRQRLKSHGSFAIIRQQLGSYVAMMSSFHRDRSVILEIF